MPTTIETTAYTFDELSDEAKQRARDWYREASYSDAYDFDCVIDDFVTIAEMIGVTFKTHEVKLMNGETRSEPRISWSGFCSQGDGASFEGSYTYRNDATVKVREYAPCDDKLHAIVDGLDVVQRANLCGLEAVIERRSSHYCHENTVGINVIDLRDMDRDDIAIQKAEQEIDQCLRDLMRWLYKQLDRENDYINSDEYIDETIEANEYMFTQEGDRHAYA